MELPASHQQREVTEIKLDSTHGQGAFVLSLRVCPNQRCRGLTARVSMHSLREDNRGMLRPAPEPDRTWQLVPAGSRALPDYVPAHVRKEYEEAWAVRESSPNAAATLARRCLQAIIRDFWGIQKGMLAAELDAVREKCEPETWNAIAGVRAMGQIGAHLDKGANLILDCDPGEPERLLALIDYLIEDWYAARHKRQERLSALRENAVPAVSARPMPPPVPPKR
jgi:hypothetical protein